MKVTNAEARNYVLRKESFKTGNETIFAKRYEDTYVVYSYGEHFPMYVFDFNAEEWWGNQDKYSRTTSCHQSKTRPPNVCKWVDTETLKRVAYNGVVGAVADRIAA